MTRRGRSRGNTSKADAIRALARARELPWYDRPYLNPAEAGQLLGLTEEEVLEDLAASRLPGYRLGAVIVVDTQAVRSLLRDAEPLGRLCDVLVKVARIGGRAVNSDDADPR
jgi:hypothetical protein